MGRPRGPAVPLALLVVLAGCAGVGHGPASPTPTATASLPDRLPPGLSESNVSAPLDLARAHTAALTGTSFSYRETVVVSTTDGIELGRMRVVRRVDRDGAFVHRMRVEGVVPSVVTNVRAVDAYSNGTVVVIRFRQADENRTLVTAARESPIAAYDVVGKGRLYSMLTATRPTVEGAFTRGGTTYVHVRGANGSTTLGFVAASNATFEALVAPSGLVKRSAFSYRAEDTTHREWTGRIDHRAVYDDVGTTTLTRPAWVDEELPDATAVPTGR